MDDWNLLGQACDHYDVESEDLELMDEKERQVLIDSYLAASSFGKWASCITNYSKVRLYHNLEPHDDITNAQILSYYNECVR